MWSKAWWKDVSERTIRTFAATFAGLMFVGSGEKVIGYTEFINSWGDILWGAGASAVMTLLMAIATHGVTGNGPSFTSVYKDKKTGESDKDDRTDAAA